MDNFGVIDINKVRELARQAGITEDELAEELAARNLDGLSFAA